MMNPKTEATASSILACSNPHVSSKSNSDFCQRCFDRDPSAKPMSSTFFHQKKNKDNTIQTKTC